MPEAVSVTELGALDVGAVRRLLARYGVVLVEVPPGRPIPCSYWGAPEAGLERGRVYARADTPVHSLMHEPGHYVCKDRARRDSLAADAGGDPDEEVAVCYIQDVHAVAETCIGMG